MPKRLLSAAARLKILSAFSLFHRPGRGRGFPEWPGLPGAHEVIYYVPEAVAADEVAGSAVRADKDALSGFVEEAANAADRLPLAATWNRLLCGWHGQFPRSGFSP